MEIMILRLNLRMALAKHMEQISNDLLPMEEGSL
jgi:hypothetical protein